MSETIKIKRKPFFNDSQIKRHLLQVLSNFSGYQVVTGTQRNGKHLFVDVPVVYADMSRAVAYLTSGSDHNAALGPPIMSIHMTSMRQSDEYRLNPMHSEPFTYTERAKDADGNYLVGQEGQKKTMERYMPVPYVIGLQVTIWAANNDQGYQLVEQLASEYNSHNELMLSNSPADWGSLTNLQFQGDVNMEKAIPAGADDDPLYVFNMDFTSMLWLSLPAKVYDQEVIEEVHVELFDMEGDAPDTTTQILDGLIIKKDANGATVVASL